MSKLKFIETSKEDGTREFINLYDAELITYASSERDWCTIDFPSGASVTLNLPYDIFRQMMVINESEWPEVFSQVEVEP